MAPTRQSTPIHPAHYDLDSPDPLGESSSLNIHSGPTTRRRSAANNNSIAQKSVASNLQRQSHEFELSPSKMIAEQGQSPWRIKVTVEAEPENQENAPRVSSGRTQTVTKTVKIPLRDASSPTHTSSPKKKTAATRRSASPARTRSRRQSVTDLDIVVLGDDADEDEWSARSKSPKKRRGSRAASPKKGRGVGRKSGSGVFEVKEDEGMPGEEQADVEHRETEYSPELQELDLNRVHTKARSDSIKQKDLQQHSAAKEYRRTVSNTSAMSYPTPSPTASEHAHSDEKDDGEPHDDHEVGLDTMVESEGFTMIDLDSIPSVRHLRQSPEYPSIPEESSQSNIEHQEDSQEVNNTTHDADDATREGPSIAVIHSDSGISSDLPSSPPDPSTGKKCKTYSIGHLKLPSSTNLQRHRLVTPMPTAANPYSSPKLPSPPGAPQSSVKERSSVHSDQAELAGEVLQSSLMDETRSQHESRNIPKSRPPIFEAFSSSTRRQLSAELKFGEELGEKVAQNQMPQMLRPKQRYFVPLNDIPANQVPVWRGETTVQHTPPVVERTQKDNLDAVFEANQTRLERERQKERSDVVREAERSEAVTIEDDEESEEIEQDVDDGETTMGDIWLAEARPKSSGPKEQKAEMQQQYQPRRKLIPSPWKRGQQLQASQGPSDESFSGLFWKQSDPSSSSGAFGEAVIENPEKVTRKVSNTRRRQSGMYDADQMTITPIKPSRLSQQLGEFDEDSDDQDFEDDNFNNARDGVHWRSAADVIDEETNELEAEHGRADPGTTRLYETNLEDVPDQDLSSSPQRQFSKEQHHVLTDHDSTYSSISNESSDVYRQRTSLSPSKERPNTPRSAIKGARASFGAALNFDDGSEGERRRVVWAKRSSCVNEKWEESTRSVRSSQTEDDSEQSILAKKQGLQLEAAFEVDPQPPAQEQQSARGWFGWFQSGPNTRSGTEEAPQARPQPARIHSLDGSIDDFVRDDNEDDSQASFAPTSRHASIEFNVKQTRSQNTGINNNDGNLSHRSSTSSQISVPPTQMQASLTQSHTSLPSYLLPPSYPTDRSRDPTIPLPTSGPFTNTHFRTLHILYRKSQRPRFHGPAFPSEIRPTILALTGHNSKSESQSQSQFKLLIDESRTMGEEDGLFIFSVGAVEAQVLERFMREVEHGYYHQQQQQQKTGNGGEDGENEVKVEWGWTAEDLAEKLGRIAIGEVVREEEKASLEILRSARRSR